MVPGSTLLPPSRSSSGFAYDQTNRLFYIYGGEKGANEYTDLWRFNLTSKVWTFMQGLTTTSNVGSYPTVTLGSGSTFYPGSRTGATLTLTTTFLYLFGGSGSGKTGSVSYLNDFWRYNLVTNAWQWIGGTPTVVAAGTYGTKGVSTATTFPGSRSYHAAFYDPASKSVCIFGGKGVSQKYWK